MKKLIQGEKIRIDNHQSGVPLVWNSNQDIHLHKTTTISHKGSSVSVTVRIPLNSDRKISIESNKANAKASTETEIRKKMIEEIREAFESSQNSTKRDNFLKSLIDEINLINGHSSDLSQKAVEKTFDRIMKCFGLNKSVKSIMMNTVSEYFKTYYDDEHKYYLFAKSDITEIGELTSNERQKYSQKGFECE